MLQLLFYRNPKIQKTPYKLPSVYQFNKRWSIRGKPKYNDLGQYENREIKYSVNLEDSVID